MIYKWIYIPTLHCGPELQVMTKKNWITDTSDQNEFRTVAIRNRYEHLLLDVAGTTLFQAVVLRNKVRSSDIKKELGVEPLLHHIELGWHMGALLWRYHGHIQLGEDARADPEHVRVILDFSSSLSINTVPKFTDKAAKRKLVFGGIINCDQ